MDVERLSIAAAGFMPEGLLPIPSSCRRDRRECRPSGRTGSGLRYRREPCDRRRIHCIDGVSKSEPLAAARREAHGR